MSMNNNNNKNKSQFLSKIYRLRKCWNKCNQVKDKNRIKENGKENIGKWSMDLVARMIRNFNFLGNWLGFKCRLIKIKQFLVLHSYLMMKMGWDSNLFKANVATLNWNGNWNLMTRSQNYQVALSNKLPSLTNCCDQEQQFRSLWISHCLTFYF